MGKHQAVPRSPPRIVKLASLTSCLLRFTTKCMHPHQPNDNERREEVNIQADRSGILCCMHGGEACECVTKM